MWGLTPWDNFNQLSFTLSEMHCLGGIYSPATGQKKEPRSFYFHFFVITLCPLPELHKESFCHVTAGVSCGPKSHVFVSLGTATPTMSWRGAGAAASGCGTHVHLQGSLPAHKDQCFYWSFSDSEGKTALLSLPVTGQPRRARAGFSPGVAALHGLGHSLAMIEELVLGLLLVRTGELCVTIGIGQAHAGVNWAYRKCTHRWDNLWHQLPTFSSENGEFPVQGVEADVIEKILPCFEISKRGQSSPVHTHRWIMWLWITTGSFLINRYSPKNKKTKKN